MEHHEQTLNKFFPEVHERAVRLVLDSRRPRISGPFGSMHSEHHARRQVVDALRQLGSPRIDEAQAFAAAGRPRKLARGQAFCAPGQTGLELAFIVSGILRYAVLCRDGTEATKDFGFSGSFAVAFADAVSGRQEASIGIYAVRRTELLVWPYAAVERLYDRPGWDRVGRRIAEMLFVRKERREMAFLLESAEERYDRLRLTLGSGIEQIPQHFIASYLGIQPQSLSRLRRRMNLTRQGGKPRHVNPG